MKTYTLWARVGITVKVKEHEREEFLENPEKFIENGLKTGSAFFDGETYFPQGDGDDNDEILKGAYS